MRLSGLAAVAAAVALALVQGCAAEADAPAPAPYQGDGFGERVPVRFVKQAVNVDQAFANSVEVQDDRLVVPTASNRAMLERIAIGAIVAGNRDLLSADLATSKNPYGFLRRVTSIETRGEQTVLQTVKAELADWIEEGDLFFDEQQSILEGAQPIGKQAQQLRIQANSGGGSGSASAALNAALEGDETPSADGKVRVKPIIKLTNASFDFNAKYDGYFRVRRTFGIPTNVKFRSHLALDPVVAADIQAGIALNGATPGTTAIGSAPSVPLWEKSWRGPSAVIPIGGPIPLTLRFAPELKCSLSAGGAVTATVHAEVRAHAATGFEGSAGVGSFDLKDLSESPTMDPSLRLLGVQGKATMTAECQILAVPVVLAFDAVGLEGKIGPYVSLNANACATFDARSNEIDTGFNLYEQHGLAGEFAGRVQVPFIGIGKSFELLTVRALKSDELYLVGDAKSCDVRSVDSCQGRVDGFYCSELEAYSGFYCEGGQIASGHQCAPAKKCTGGTRETITCK
ncbi:MAG: hypothetical protein K0S65_1614 [Labilithrix sp.]|nr:hypothetical protein [Labilithrix sp.]